MLSYAHGAYPEPLLGETIGRQPRADDRARPRCRRAGVLPPGRALHLRAVRRGGRPARRRDARRRAEQGRPGRRLGPQPGRVGAVQYATARAGVILVNINPAYRLHELQYALGQSGCRWIFSTQQLKGSDFVEMVDHVRPELPDARARGLLRHRRVGGARLRRRLHRRPHAPGGRARLRRPDQHPVHERHHRLPQGRHPQPPQHPQQRLLHRASCSDTASTTRVCIPVPLYHCFGMVLGNLAATSHGAVHGVSGRDVRARWPRSEACAEERCTSLYGVPTMFIAELGHERFSEFDLQLAADRDHGGLAVPDRGDEAGQRRDGDRRDEHLRSA